MPLSLTLRPMSAAYFAGWNERLIVEYAREKVQAGVWTEEHALGLSKAEQKASLPDGMQTPGHDLFVGTIDREIVGNLWLFTDPGKPVRDTFIYDIEINEANRGRGLGRALLEAAESWCVEHGIAMLRLNVFSFNTTAIQLYESAGFTPTNMNMMKRIAPA